jgi:hypothetical protein
MRAFIIRPFGTRLRFLDGRGRWEKAGLSKSFLGLLARVGAGRCRLESVSRHLRRICAELRGQFVFTRELPA